LLLRDPVDQHDSRHETSPQPFVTAFAVLPTSFLEEGQKLMTVYIGIVSQKGGVDLCWALGKASSWREYSLRHPSKSLDQSPSFPKILEA
jgi:hypothetical protein